jgi:hypothetical protein
VRQNGRGGHDELLDVGREPVGGDADVILLHRRVAPGDDPLALGLDGVGQQPLERGAALGVLREEADGDAVLPGRRKLGADDAAQQLVGQLQQHPGAVAGVRVGTCGTAVLEVLEGGDRPLDGLVARLAAQPRDERNAARVVLVSRVVQTDRLGRSLALRQASAPEGRGVGTGGPKVSSGRGARAAVGRRFDARRRRLDGP